MWTVNTGGQASNRVSDTATPYGPTLQPTGLSSSRSGNQITWQWNLPENGRPIQRVQVRGAVDQTFESARQQVSFNGQDGQTYRLEVRAYAGGSWSSWAGPDSQTIPDPKTVTVLKGSTCGERSCNTGNGSCTSAGCRWIAVRTSGFNGDVTCTFRQNGGAVAGWTEPVDAAATRRGRATTSTAAQDASQRPVTGCPTASTGSAAAQGARRPGPQR